MTTITVSPETKDKYAEEKGEDETWDDVLERLYETATADDGETAGNTAPPNDADGPSVEGESLPSGVGRVTDSDEIREELEALQRSVRDVEQQLEHLPNSVAERLR